MPNINLTDSRKRDAVVKAENIGVSEDIRYVDTGGNNAYTRKILKATVDHDYDTLIKTYNDDPEKLALAIVDSDPEVDMEKCGVFLWGVSKVYVNSDDGIVYRIEQTEIVRDAHGEVKERRPRRRSESNVDSEIPLTWTGKQIDKGEALRKFVFASKLQIVHVNGLTYDFLYGMASELAENDSLMIVGGGQKGRDPLIFRSGSIPYHGFLEGRVAGDKYILLLHLSNMELKLPTNKPQKVEEVKAKSAVVDKPEEKDSTADSKAAEKHHKKPDEAATPRKKDVKKKTAAKSKISNEAPATGEAGSEKTSSKNKNKKEASKNEESQSEPVEEKNSGGDAGKTGGGKTAGKTQKDKVASPVVDNSGPAPESVTSEDLGVWLKSVRMGKYLPLFIENEIDVDVLPELTDADLKELDIPVGSRRRLLKAVAETEDLRAEVSMTVRKLAKAARG